MSGDWCSGTERHSRVELTPLQRADVHTCAHLERVLFPTDDPWSAEAFSAELDQGVHYLAARVDGRLVGYAGLAVLGRPPDLEAEVHTIGVDPEHQHRGVGRLLLRALLAHADGRGAATYLEVRTDNQAAIRLYRSEGFEVVGRRRRYYRPSGADAYTMRRPPRPIRADAAASANAATTVNTANTTNTANTADAAKAAKAAERSVREEAT